MLADSESGESLLPESQTDFLLCPHRVERTQKFSLVTSIKSVVLLMRAELPTSQRPHPPNNITLRVRFQYMNLRVTMNVWSIATSYYQACLLGKVECTVINLSVKYWRILIRGKTRLSLLLRPPFSYRQVPMV